MFAKCQDVILETKRALGNEDVQTIPTYTSKCSKKYAKLLDWKNESFWNEVPNPKNNSFRKNTPKIESITKQYVDSIFGDLLKSGVNTPKITCQSDDSNNKTHFLSKKYFSIWRSALELKREQKKQQDDQLKRQIKLEEFMKKLRKRKNKKKSQKIDENSQDKETFTKNDSKPRSSFKNRFDAQKTIIQLQKAKLEEQNKTIEELKLGIISDDLLKSIENSKTNIREIFGNCSEKIKYKIPLILGEERRFLVSSRGAPTVVQKMEQRALERSKNRQIILERKQLIEAARQKMLQEAIEKKRVLEEEEKKLSLELIKERRRKEMENDKIRQANKHKYLEKLSKAIEFHNKSLLNQCFRKIYNNKKIEREKYFSAIDYYENKTFKQCIDNWKGLVESTYKVKYDIADAHFEYKVLKKYVKLWRKARTESVRNMQVAEDVYDFRLTSNVFIHWNRYACIQFMKERKRSKKAQRHYKRWLLFHYFYLWRSLKVVNELERAKELKKVKWRQKVWEILPDYKPPEDI